jgi:aryl-alcohol dehydrogenase-like predicted oxidoreductase
MVGNNVIRRYPETNGVFDICEKEGISLIPYAPLAEGALTGKYRGGKKVPLKYAVTSYWGHLNITKERNDDMSLLKRIFSKPRESDIKRMEPLMQIMEEAANNHGKSLAQVAINWLITQERVNVVPIPGVRSVKQATDNAGAIGWTLTEEEREKINRAEESTRY